jgi:5-bromo-4-chloroindolyl phosphate hydrolysis protein
MQPEMTLIDAMQRIQQLESQLAFSLIFFAITVLVLFGLSIGIANHAGKFAKRAIELEELNLKLQSEKNETDALRMNLGKAEETIARLQGRPIQRNSKQEVVGDAGDLDQIVKDSICEFGPGGSSSFGI